MRLSPEAGLSLPKSHAPVLSPPLVGLATGRQFSRQTAKQDLAPLVLPGLCQVQVRIEELGRGKRHIFGPIHNRHLEGLLQDLLRAMNHFATTHEILIDNRRIGEDHFGTARRQRSEHWFNRSMDLANWAALKATRFEVR